MNVKLILFWVDAVCVEELLVLKCGGFWLFAGLWRWSSSSGWKEHNFQNLIEIIIELRHSLIKRLLNRVQILLKQLRYNRQILILKPYPINRTILLTQSSHQLIRISKNKLILKFGYERILLWWSCQVVCSWTHFQETSNLI